MRSPCKPFDYKDLKETNWIELIFVEVVNAHVSPKAASTSSKPNRRVEFRRRNLSEYLLLEFAFFLQFLSSLPSLILKASFFKLSTNTHTPKPHTRRPANLTFLVDTTQPLYNF